VKQWRGVRERDALRLCHAIRDEDRLSGLKRPWPVMDVEAEPPAAWVLRIQAIALGQEILERARLGRANGSVRRVGSLEGHMAAGANRGVHNGLAFRPQIHPGKKVRQMREHSRGHDRRSSRGVKADEPNARLPVAFDAGTPQGCVRIARGVAETAALTAGEVTLEKIRETAAA